MWMSSGTMGLDPLSIAPKVLEGPLASNRQHALPILEGSVQRICGLAENRRRVPIREVGDA